MEKHTIKKTGQSKYGYYILIDNGEKGIFKGCTPQVNNYLSDKTPCTVIIEETTGQGRDEVVTKVRVLQEGKVLGQKPQDQYRLNIDAGNCVDRAIKLIELGKADDLDHGLQLAIAAFYTAVEGLSDKEKFHKALLSDEDSEKSEPQTGLNSEGVFE